MQQPRSNTLVVVDGYSSGSHLPAVMREYGWECIHVRALARPPAYYLSTFKAEDYQARFVYDGDIDRLAGQIAPLNPAAVLPGTESGVIVADRLAAALGLPGNDPSTSSARRNKSEMIGRVKAHGLRGPDDFLCRRLDDLVAWSQAGPWPVVLKPVASAGTDSVMFCDDRAELEAGFRRLLGSTNQLGERNDTVLAQRMLVGQEYFINGISGGGRHIVTEVWRTDKIRLAGAGLMYDRSVLFDPAEPDLQELVGYVCQVLDALGVRYGATHTEVMVTDRGPTLIECASRLSGGINRAAANFAVGASQLDLVAKLVVQGESFVGSLFREGLPLRHPLWQVQFISHQSGTVVRSNADEMMRELGSRGWLHKAPKAGESVERTTDLFTSPGIVFFSHLDAAVLQADYETIRAWEQDGRLFVLE